MSVGIDQIWFELQRRVPLFKSGTLMPDKTLLGYDGDPNLTATTGTQGEALLAYATQGTFFQQSNGTMWRKSLLPNVWVEVGTGTGGGGGTGGIDLNDDLTFTGDITFNSEQLVLGDGTNSTIYITSPLDGDLIPSLDGTYDIGTTSKRWQSIFTEDVYTAQTTTNKIYFSGNSGDIAATGDYCSLTGPASEVYSLDWEDVREIKEAQTIVNCHSARWTNEHIHMVSRGSYTMDTPATDVGFGPEPEFICMQANNFAGDAKYQNLDHTHALVLPYDTYVKKVILRASASAGDTVRMGLHSNTDLEPIDGYSYVYFSEQPMAQESIQFDNNFETKVFTFGPGASAREGETLGISLSSQSAINATSVTVVLVMSS